MKSRTDPEVLKLALEAQCDPRTAARALDGEELRPLVRERIRRAAQKLKIKLPEA